MAAWVRQMAVLRESIRQLEKRIAERAAQQEDGIFSNLYPEPVWRWRPV